MKVQEAGGTNTVTVVIIGRVNPLHDLEGEGSLQSPREAPTTGGLRQMHS